MRNCDICVARWLQLKTCYSSSCLCSYFRASVGLPLRRAEPLDVRTTIDIVKQVTAALGAPYVGFNWRFCERYLKRQLDFVIVSFDGVYRCARCVADYTVLA
jgi:hypothetical protein